MYASVGRLEGEGNVIEKPSMGSRDRVIAPTAKAITLVGLE
jgi:hypothetical protein